MDNYTRMQKIVDLLGVTYETLKVQLMSGEDATTGEDVTQAAVDYANAFQALQLYRIANTLEHSIAPALSTIDPSLVNAITALDMTLGSK